MKTNSFLSLLRQDMTIIYRNGYMHVVFGLAVLFIILVNFVIPGEAKIATPEYLVDQTAGQLITPLAVAKGLEEYLLTSEEELQQALAQNNQAVGIIYRGDRENPEATIYHQGSEPDKLMRIMEAAVISFWNSAGELEQPVSHRLEFLRPAVEKPAFNLTLVPVLLTLESALIGLFFVSALIFQEKEEGSIRAFRVSPGGTWTYIISKITVNLILSLLSGLLIFILTLGFRPELPAVLLLVTLVSLLLTTFGLTISVYYKNLSEFIYVLAVVMTIATLPMASYFTPSFSLTFLPYIPTYPLLFGIRELVFSTGMTGFYLPILLILAFEILVILILAKVAVERKLMKEGY